MAKKRTKQELCKICKGKKKVKCSCWQVRQQNPDLAIDCPYCDNSGYRPCQRCEGTGLEYEKTVVRRTENE